MPRDEHAYLSIVQWPGGMDETDKVEALVLAAGMDPDQAALAVRRGTPQVVLRLSSLIRSEVLRSLHANSVTAICPTTTELASSGPVRRIKSIAITPGRLVCQMWRQDPVELDPADLLLIVRGRLKQVTERSTITHTQGYQGALAWSIGGPELALGLGLAGLGDRAQVHRDSEINQSQQAELFLRDNTRLRLDADKLNFDVLGDQRGYSDHINMDRLIDLVRHLAPKALVDEGFGDFRCPPGLAREHARAIGLRLVRTTNEHPAFEFYAPWANLLYRHMLGLDRTA